MELDFADVKPSVLNVVIVTLIVVVTIPLLKALMVRYPVPGLSNLVLSV